MELAEVEKWLLISGPCVSERPGIPRHVRHFVDVVTFPRREVD